MSNSTTSIQYPEIWDIARFDGLMFTLLVIAAVTTVLRLLTRGFYLRALGADDILAVIATFTFAALAAFEHLKNFNNNRYLQAVRDGEPIESGPTVTKLLTEVERMTLLNGLAYVITLCLIKCSILAFYRRIIVRKEHRYTIYATGQLIVSYTIAYIIAKCVAHDPPASVWNPYDPKYGGKVKCTCALLAVINSSFQAVFDIIILVFPALIFRTVKVTHGIKVGVGFIYLLGLFSFTTTIVRLSWAVRYLLMKDFVLLHEKLIEFSAWTVVEVGTALVCANLPPMTTILRRTFNRFASSIGLSSASRSGEADSGEKSGSKSATSGSSRRKQYLRAIRHKHSGSEAEARLAHKAAPFSFGQVHAPALPSDDKTDPTLTSSVSSPRDVPNLAMATPAAVQPTSLHSHAHSTPPPGIVEIETDVDVEKANYDYIDHNVHTNGNSNSNSNVGGLNSSGKDFALGLGNTLGHAESRKPSALLAPPPWGTVTTVTGSGSTSNSNNYTAGNSGSTSGRAASTTGHHSPIGTCLGMAHGGGDDGSVGNNNNCSNTTTAGAGPGSGRARSRSRSRSRLGMGMGMGMGMLGLGRHGAARDQEREREKEKEKELETNATAKSTDSYQLGLPIQRLDSGKF